MKRSFGIVSPHDSFRRALLPISMYQVLAANVVPFLPDMAYMRSINVLRLDADRDLPLS